MNLYGFSQNNNIEAGVLMEKNSMAVFTGGKNLEEDSWLYFETVLKQADLLFEKQPTYSKNMLGTKKYVNSEIITDKLSEFFNNKASQKVFKKNLPKTENKKIVTSKSGMGYCIRTGKEIPFNTKKPMQDEAFEMWNKFKNADFPEKYCHFSGELSNGETSMNKPILKKHWKDAKEMFNF